jgi:hypothetical protein
MDSNVVVALITAAGTMVAALIAREQRRQKGEIDALSFVVNHFLPYWELDHLEKLARGEPLPYDKQKYPDFESEVRQLKDRKLIAPRQAGFHVGELPVRGNLQQHYELSNDGKKFLRLLEQIKAKEVHQND